MRHLGHVGDDRCTAHIFAQGQFELAPIGLKLLAINHLAHAHHCDGRVRNLDTHSSLAGNGSLDADRRCGHCQGQILLQRGDLAHLHAHGGLQFKLCYRRTRVHIHHLGLNLETGQGLLDQPRASADILVANAHFAAVGVEEVECRQRPCSMHHRHIKTLQCFLHRRVNRFRDGVWAGGGGCGRRVGSLRSAQGWGRHALAYGWSRRTRDLLRRTLGRSNRRRLAARALKETGLRRAGRNRSRHQIFIICTEGR